MKTTLQILYVKGLVDNYNDGDARKVLKDYLPIDENERRRPDLEEVNEDNVIQWFYS